MGTNVCFMLLDSSLASLCFGAFVELTIGVMGECYWSIFIIPLIVGGEVLRLIYFNYHRRA